MTAQAVQKAPTRVMTFPTTLVGYARVSTDAQSLEAQMAALEAAGCERIYAEKRSGAETDRKTLAKLLKEASPGDTVVVTRLDRLARSTRDLLVRLGKDNIGFKSLRETSVDTTSPQGRLVVNILASISEFERELIHARMTEGRKRAVANGVKFGPKFKLNSFQRQEALARLAAGGSQSVVAKTYGVDPATISRLQGRRLAPTKAAGGYTPTGGQRHATTVARRVSRQAHRRSPATNRSRAEDQRPPNGLVCHRRQFADLVHFLGTEPGPAKHPHRRVDGDSVGSAAVGRAGGV